MGNIVKRIKAIGIKKTIQRFLQKLIGVSEIGDIKEELNCLQYYFNSFHKASDAPPASDPDLRILQRCDAELLRVVTGEIKKLGLTYWLDYGTLLGAVRHNGFIPWDDDMDISMPREDYNKALVLLKEALEPKGFSFKEASRIAIGYKFDSTGLWLDIFAVDNYNSNNNIEDVRKALGVSLPKFQKKFFANYSKATKDWIAENRKKIIGGEKGNNKFLYMQAEFPYIKVIAHPYENVYPLSETTFEGYTFNSPKDSDLHLKDIYGKNYMNFPRRGILHHDEGRGPLSTWANNHGVDMKEILKELEAM